MSHPGVVAYRKSFMTPGFILSALQTNSHILLDPPPGSGKTSLAKSIIASPDFQREYRIVYLADTRAILEEFPEVRNYQTRKDSDVLVLQRRPGTLCGNLDAEWSALEKSGNSEYARHTLCKICPNRSKCEWRTQFSREVIANRRVIFGVTDYLFLIPGFLHTFIEENTDRKTLLIVDEPGIVTKSSQVKIKATDLRKFRNALDQVNHSSSLVAERKEVALTWQSSCDSLLADPRLVDRPLDFPPLGHDLVLNIQGVGLTGNRNFKYLGHVLRAFGESHSRFKHFDAVSDSYVFANHPKFYSADVVLIGANLDEELVNLRLNQMSFRAVMPPCPPKHPQSKIINVGSSAGSKYNFTRHGDTVLQLTAHLIVELRKKSKKVLLISKKCFIDRIQKILPTLIHEISGDDIEITSTDFGADLLADPRKIPIINYGIVGVNAFEDFDYAICTNSFYLSPEVIHEKIYETLPEIRGVQFEIKIRNGKRILVPTENIALESYYIRIANKILFLFETLPVEQAAGRVRYINFERTVILMNRSNFNVPVDEELKTLADFRSYLGVPTNKRSRYLERRQLAHQLRNSGLEISEIARQIGVSQSSVYKYLDLKMELRP